MFSPQGAHLRKVHKVIHMAIFTSSKTASQRFFHGFLSEFLRTPKNGIYARFMPGSCWISRMHPNAGFEKLENITEIHYFLGI
jgi:hypothetical protein